MLLAPLHYQAQLPRCYSFMIFLYLTLFVAKCKYTLVYACVCVFSCSIIWFLALKDGIVFICNSLPLSFNDFSSSVTPNFCLNATLFNTEFSFSPEDTPILQNSYQFLTHYINNSLMFIVSLQYSVNFMRAVSCCLQLYSKHLQKCLAYS